MWQGLILQQTFAEISEKIGHAAREQNLIESEEVEALDPSSADTVIPFSKVFYGTNARGNSRRAKEFLGWEPREESLDAEIPKTVAGEAK